MRNWIEAEVGDLVSRRLYAADVSALIDLLARGGASRSELLVLDLDLLSAPHTVGLKLGIEDRWWNGTIVAIGSQRSMHRRNLTIEHTIGRPLGSEALRAVVEGSAGEDTHAMLVWRGEKLNKRNGTGR
ncbi:MAG TPA: hypothetical protein VFQ65_15995 [Kofleriaceae bacterium]|nr:hypothetical protein [Kofleriaceae bacterium]